MKKFANFYTGQQCFLVGNGPSLNDTPLDYLEHQYSFATNQINLIYDQTIWRPTFYVAETARGWHWSSTWRKNITENVLYHNLVSFVSRSIPLRGINVYPITMRFKAIYKGGIVPVFSKNCAEMVGHLGTTMYAMFQLAAWMGFNPIFFVGCDLGYKAEDGESRGHFKDDYWGDRAIRQPMTDETCERINRNTLIAHRAMRAYAKDNGIDVYNATVGGELELWPRMDFEVATR
jgi:hypothetical protein